MRKFTLFFLILYVVVGAVALAGWFYFDAQTESEGIKADALQKEVNQKQSERNILADEVNTPPVIVRPKPLPEESA